MTVSTQPDWATELIELLEKQRTIYHQLGEFSRRQAQLVQAGDAEPLLTLLAQRQQLIDHLTQINARIEPLKQDWPTRWAQLEPGVQMRIQQLIDGVQKLIDVIVEQDEKDRAALNARRQHVADGVRQMRQGAAVNKAYGRPASGPDNNRYTDFNG